jgi:hypothetical protein
LKAAAAFFSTRARHNEHRQRPRLKSGQRVLQQHNHILE